MVHYLGAVDLCPEYEPLGVHQQVSLMALDLLAAVVSSFFPAYAGALDRLLGIHYAGRVG